MKAIVWLPPEVEPIIERLVGDGADDRAAVLGRFLSEALLSYERAEEEAAVEAVIRQAEAMARATDPRSV